jgi:anti-sigma B factor antagonist
MVVVKVQGEVDVYTAPMMKEEVQRSIDAGLTRVVVDLSGVAYMDSSGLGVLIGALKRAREGGGDLIVSAPNARITRIMDVTGLGRIFNVHTATDGALKSLKGTGQ